jgi:hypothetical protein
VTPKIYKEVEEEITKPSKPNALVGMENENDGHQIISE